ncbi:MAG: lipid A deacylase LpxR family protein [Paracoccaceae bacterium]|nr:lipid A deacylase LpxR family protein [Paracoccaceae bacterium]
MCLRMATVSVAFAATLFQSPVHAGGFGALDGWDWLASSREIQGATLVWNDGLGDGQDRWKTGGLSQSVILPESSLGSVHWIDDQASALEVTLRALLMTPDNTAAAVADGDDRAFAQYAGAGVFLRTFSQPATAPGDFGIQGLLIQTDDRVGIELGWQGDPLPLFEIQEAFHGMTGAGGGRGNPANSIGGEPLVNLEARRTWRLLAEGPGRDVEFAPFLQTSLGMRENSLRVGGDFFVGSALEGRIWGSDPATGAAFSQASMPRPGTNWTLFAGGDLGYIASDAFLDGGVTADGPSVERRDLVGRARAGILVEHGRVGLGFSLNWLGREFESQPEGQLVGALQVRVRF